MLLAMKVEVRWCVHVFDVLVTLLVALWKSCESFERELHACIRRRLKDICIGTKAIRLILIWIGYCSRHFTTVLDNGGV